MIHHKKETNDCPDFKKLCGFSSGKNRFDELASRIDGNISDKLPWYLCDVWEKNHRCCLSAFDTA